ncbi:MAG: outer membrane beta-barrel family protein [Crocinitomicaceae bacterium]
MKTAHILLLLIFIYLPSKGISQTWVKGNLNVRDTSFVSGNLLILKLEDSSLITGQYLNSTRFEIQSDLPSFLMKIQLLGYKEKWIKIANSTDLGIVNMEEENLGEITVLAEKLPFQLSNGNPKMNIQNSVFSNSASFQELIQKMPGVIVQGDEIQIVGRGKAKIYIDGMETTLNAANSLPASQIETVEIVKNPDATIDADGFASIQIKLKKQKQNGVTGSILAHYTKAFYHLGYLDLNTQFRYGKWSFNLGANCNFGQTGVQRKSDNYLNRDSLTYQILSEYRERTALNGVSNWIAGVQYHFNENHSIGLQYNGNYSDFTLDVQTDLKNIYSDSSSTIFADANAKTINSSHRASFNYQGILDSLESKLFVGFSFNHLPSSYLDSILENIHGENMNLLQLSISKGDNLVDLYTGQIDFTKNFDTKYSFKTGAKYNYSNLNSHLYLLSNFSTEQINFYQEHVVGAYIQGGFHFEKVQLNLGCRVEYTLAKAIEKINDDAFLDSSYISVFPYLDLSIPTKKWTFTTKFSSNIDRPSFSEMTPYIYYVNSMFGVIGNPYIRPGLTYGIEQQFSANETGTSINIGYRYTKNPTSIIPQQNNGFANTVYQIVNLDRKDEYFIELNQSLNFKHLFCYLSSSLSYEKFKDQEIRLQNGINFPKFYLYVYFRYSLPKWFNLELFGSLTSAYSDGVVQFDTQGDIGLAISRKFFKDKLLVQISGNDLFQTAKMKPRIGVNGEQFNAAITSDTRYFRISLTYSFGKLKDSKYDHHAVGDENENRAK